MKVKEQLLPFLKKNKSIILSLAGALILGGSVFFLENEIAAGIACTLGLILTLCGGRCALTRREVICSCVLLWAGHVFRYCGLFGSKFLYTLCCAAALIPYCALIAFALWLDRKLRKKGHRFLATLALPAGYALCAFLLAALNFGFTFNLMSYTMCIPVIAVNLSLLGEYLLTFVLMWIFICLTAVSVETDKNTKVICVFVSVVLTLALTVSGCVLRSGWDEPDYTIKVALATSQELDFTGEVGKIYTDEQQIEMFVSAIKQADEDGAKLLVLNEEYFFTEEENYEQMLSRVSEIVCEYGIPTLAGIEIVREDEQNINEAIYFDADGQILCTYVKNNLVAFIEAGYYVDGEEEPAVIQTVIDGHEINLAFIICYDINDGMYLSKIPSDTELLLVPSWDWDNVNLEQKRTFVRSAELGVTVIKHTFEGFSYVSAPNGDLADEADFRSCFEDVKTVTVPIWEK